jgi:hypothetical protein
VCIKLKLIQCYRENLCQYCACYPLLRAYYPMESHCLAVLGHCHLQGVRRDLLLAGKKNSCEYIYIYRCMVIYCEINIGKQSPTTKIELTQGQ